MSKYTIKFSLLKTVDDWDPKEGAKHLEDTFRHHANQETPMPAKSKKSKYPKLRGRSRNLASKYIAKEMETKKYPRAQAIAIGVSRTKSKVRKATHKK